MVLFGKRSRPHWVWVTIALFCAGLSWGQDSSGIPSPQPWTTLLQRCVAPTPGDGSTAVDYDCFTEHRAELDSYLATLAAVSRRDFDRWPADEQLAFLINAYNAATVQLILGAWPELESIRDLGSLLRSPWKKRFVSLLGETLTLDNIEHDTIREPGRFDEPRIHFAVNCASIGCPALRREAFTGAALEEQLEAQTRQFLGDRSRNRLRDGTLEVTSLFKWYRGDFENGWRGADSVARFLALYSEALGLDERQKAALLGGDIRIKFLDYDWNLNSVKR